VTGSRIRTLVQEQKPAGQHVVVWDGRQEDGRVAASGIFVATVTIRSERGAVYQKRVKMMMIK
jgi:flagellar hook assembly protein FlgD